MEILDSLFQAPVFKGLKVDGSLIIQFGLVIIIWGVLKLLFLDKLKEILINRERQTSGLEKQTEAALQKVQVLSEKYRLEIEAARLRAQEEFAKHREFVAQREEKKYRLAEGEVLEEGKKILRDFNDDFAQRASRVRAQAAELSHLLVNKLMGQ